MTPEELQRQTARRHQLELMLRAAQDAVREALRRHMLLGESVAATDDSGEVHMLSPEEIRKALERDG